MRTGAAAIRVSVGVADVLRWYRDRLERTGWDRPFERPTYVTMRKQLDGIQHTYTVTADVDRAELDDPTTTSRLFIEYRMVFFTPTTTTP